MKWKTLRTVSEGMETLSARQFPVNLKSLHCNLYNPVKLGHNKNVQSMHGQFWKGP